MKANCGIIIVTHDSELYLKKAIQSLKEQNYSSYRIFIVDTGSKDPSYLEPFRKDPRIEVIFGPKECGFCMGNNLGYARLPSDCHYVFFLNPDAFVDNHFISDAISYLENHPKCAALTGEVFGYNIHQDCDTGRYDTTGVFQKWYGRWYDRGQGVSISKRKYPESKVPAICAAVMFCRREALQSVAFATGEIFDPSFYMYKEDVDLSLRLRKKGWDLTYVTSLRAYHCRGWDQNRKRMPYPMRLFSAKNELKIHLREKQWVSICYSWLKYLSVLILDW